MRKRHDFEGAAKRAAERTDRDLKEEMEHLPGPTWDEIRKMLPEPQDQEALDEMRRIVDQDTGHNEKIASLLKNIDRVAGVVVKVMERVR